MVSKRKETSTNSINRSILNECGVVYAIDLIGGRWKLYILYKLEDRKLRFSELKKLVPNITERMLTLQLREMERDHLVARTVYPEVPARVEYELTESGKKLIPVWKMLEEWGGEHRERIQEKVG